MKSLKNLLLGIALILVAIWTILCVLIIPYRVLLIIAAVILIAGIIFIFFGFFAGDKENLLRNSKESSPKE